MQLLVLGGGVFLGTALLDAATARGHAVSVFNRGRARSVWPSGVEVLVGDRLGALSALAGRRWDAVIDTCGYVPADIHASAAALRGTGRYLFVSSISAHASFAHAPLRDDDPLADATGVAPDDRAPALYGVQKAACEAAVRAAFGAAALIVRPGLIVGPGDPTGRFAHWPLRAAAGGDMLVPAAPPDAPLQFIDVRDLADWLVHLLEAGAAGHFNAAGPVGAACTWPALIAACVDAARARAEPAATPVEVDERFLLDNGVAPWRELPLWLPAADPACAAVMRVALDRAVGAGLRTRPLHETVAAVLGDERPLAADLARSGALTRAREAELIGRWRSR